MLNRNEKENEPEDHKEEKLKRYNSRKEICYQKKTQGGRRHFTVTRTTHGMSPCDIRRASPPRKTL